LLSRIRHDWAPLTEPNPAKEREFAPITANLSVRDCRELIDMPTGSGAGREIVYGFARAELAGQLLTQKHQSRC